MKKNYNIKLNPKKLSAGEVARHKDFDKLLRQFQSAPKPKPIYRRMGVWAGALAIAASLAFLLVYIGSGTQINTQYKQNNLAHFASQPYVNPPYKQAQAQFASYNVDVNQGGVFEYPSGSKLIVPAAAFTHKDGTPVLGEVTIKYREMHDFVDFFLSGIPMTYDSAGVEYTLESAGMIEIFAEQDGQRVNMSAGKSIDVELVSNVNVPANLNVPPSYNIYKLDQENRNWVYQNIDNMEAMEDRMPTEQLDKNDPFYQPKKELNEKMDAIEVSYENEIANLESSVPTPKKPVKPATANPQAHVFDLDFNDLKTVNAIGEIAADQKELEQMYKQYEKMLWQIDKSESISAEELKAGFSKVTDMGIRKLDTRTYELTLAKGGTSLKLKVNPVLSGSDYESALADFNRDFARYSEQIAERESALKNQKEVIIQKMEEAQAVANLNFKNAIDELRSKGMGYAVTEEIIKRKVVNRFRATGFGVWNCDRPIPPYILTLAASFKDKNGKSFKNKTAYIVDKSRNTVVRFLAEDGAAMSLNLNSQNLLWLVTDDNKIAVFRPENFKALKKETEYHEFVMEKVDKEIKDEKDVREILYL